MPEVIELMSGLGMVVIAAPILLVFFLGICSLLDRRLTEATIVKSIQAAIVVGLLAALGVLILMLAQDTRHVVVEVGEWVKMAGFHVTVKFVFDRLSVPFAILSFIVSGTIASFATRYMHRERGYNRFFVLYAVFLAGMIVASLAGTIETLFLGWELVGLSSALLVAFYQDRLGPSRNGLWIWCVYRVSDAALLLAAVVLHHMTGEGDFDQLLGAGPWPEGQASASGAQAFIVGILLLIAAAGKSGLIPFSGWLPRAMEGPTPSSAIFYGALSVHLGAYLLLRVSPLLECSLWLGAVIVVLGLSTAVLAYLIGSVQTDIKAALSFASLSQVGIIVAEIGLGFRYLALVHLLGHACLRTLQFVRASSLLHDYHALENAIGKHLPHAPFFPLRWVGTFTRASIYRLALDRGCLDSWLKMCIVAPFVRLFLWCDARERGWTDFLTGAQSRESSEVKPIPTGIEELT
ncbi:MAG TPA: proton-conducting transporter membrane subunit [Gemmataceae bacterium]|nr:proton-conducting transporter membrane subunit [Gemmataceae bacterium]